MPRLGKAIREAFYFGFQPFFMLTVFLAWWFMPTRVNSPFETAVGLLLLANGVVYALEHLVPDRRGWITTATDRKIDAFYIVARIFVLGPVFQVILILSIEPAVDALHLPTLWPEGWPIFARIVLALVIAETIAFTMHLAMHWSPLLWRCHATHHAQTKLTSARWSAGHPCEFALFQLPILFVVVVLGPQAIDVAGAIVLGRTVVMVAHSNLRLSSAPLGWLLTTPEQHRRHHSLGATPTANFGDVFIAFDRLLGTFSAEPTNRVGIGSGRELRLSEQLTLPFRMEAADAVFDLREPAEPTRPTVVRRRHMRAN